MTTNLRCLFITEPLKQPINCLDALLYPLKSSQGSRASSHRRDDLLRRPLDITVKNGQSGLGASQRILRPLQPNQRICLLNQSVSYPLARYKI